jgi:ComF family protein
MRGVGNTIKHFLRKTLRHLIPPLCPLCHDPVEDDYTLCPTCWPEVAFISAPFCNACGQPLECAMETMITCGKCLKDPFPFKAARAIFRYTFFSRGLVLKLKYGDMTYLADFLARWMVRDPAYFEDVDLIVPVPLHWTRILKRGFNQAALIGRRLSIYTQIPHDPHILKRLKATPSQGGMSKEERERNVKKAFAVSKKAKSRIQDKNILLVDDVMASGATLRFCAERLLTEGARSVKVQVACRSRV